MVSHGNSSNLPKHQMGHSISSNIHANTNYRIRNYAKIPRRKIRGDAKMPEQEEVDFVMLQVTKIMEAINKDDNVVMLNETDLLFKILSRDFKQATGINKIETEINKILKNKKEMRLLRLIQKVKNEPELSIEYYGKDLGEDERLYYEEEQENKFNKIQEDIRTSISKIVRHKLEAEMDYD